MGLYMTEFFCQGGTPCRAVKRIKKYLETNNIQKIDWSGISLDLNLIENCLAHMKNMEAQKDVGSVLEMSEAGVAHRHDHRVTQEAVGFLTGVITKGETKKYFTCKEVQSLKQTKPYTCSVTILLLFLHILYVSKTLTITF
jgi:hypothetical protein